MKKLTCEMCGSTEMVKENGVFVCQNCGCKYSIEEAKKMMVEVTGKVVIDKSSELENYILLMEEANSANKTKDTYEYAEKILQIDPTNYRAWYLKGINAVWLSTQSNVRFSEIFGEIFVCYKNTLKYVPTDKKNEVVESFKKHFENMGYSVCVLTGKSYYENPTDDDLTKNIIKAFTSFINYLYSFNNECGCCVFDIEGRYLNWFLENLFIICSNAMKTAHEKFDIFSRYDYERNKYDDRYIKTCIHNIDIFESMIGPIQNKDHLTKLEDEIESTTVSLNFAYGLRLSSIPPIDIERSNFVYSEKKFHNDRCASLCADIDTKIHAIEEKARIQAEQERLAKEEAQRAANEKYWAEHKELKKKLESNKADCDNSITKLLTKNEGIYNQIAEIRNVKYDSTNLDNQISEKRKYVAQLKTDLSKLGIFKFKEKKELQSKIASVYEEIAKLDNSLKEEIKEFEESIKKKVAPLVEEINKNVSSIAVERTKIEKIEEELNKNY